MADTMTKKVFISYSWRKQEEVSEIVERLRGVGIDTVFDIHDLNPGDDIYKFMEKSVNDDGIDYVLMFCDKSYADKANGRDGGVGTETQIITPELYKNTKQSKFIPIIIEKNERGEPYLPAFLKARKYIDLCYGNNEGFDELVRLIYEKPLKRKTPLGAPPDFSEDGHVNLLPLRNYVETVKRTELPKLDDSFIDIAVEAILDTIEFGKPGIDGIRTTIDQEISVRDLILDYFVELVNKHIQSSQIIIDIIETIHNKGFNKFQDEYKQEVVRFVLWELLLDYITICVQRKKWTELSEVISYSFYIKNDRSTSDKICDYTFFNRHLNILDGTRKGDEVRYFSFQSELLSRRPFHDIITKQNISESDIMLYHLSILSNSDYMWFPRLYVYHKGPVIETWARMRSKQFCLSVSTLFGTNTVDEIKIMIKETKMPTNIAYPGAFENAPWITDSIRIDDIGSRR